MIQIFSVDLATSETREVALAGEYFELLKASQSLDIELLDRSGGVVSLLTGAEESMYVRPGLYSTVRLKNLGSAQNVKFFYGSGDAGSRKTAGSVAVTNINGEFTQVATAVSTASVQLKPEKLDRRYLLIQNVSATQDVYLNLAGAAAAVATGIKLAANGGSLEIQGFAPTGAIYAIASAAGASIRVVQG